MKEYYIATNDDFHPYLTICNKVVADDFSPYNYCRSSCITKDVLNIFIENNPDINVAALYTKATELDVFMYGVINTDGNHITGVAALIEAYDGTLPSDTVAKIDDYYKIAYTAYTTDTLSRIAQTSLYFERDKWQRLEAEKNDSPEKKEQCFHAKRRYHTMLETIRDYSRRLGIYTRQTADRTCIAFDEFDINLFRWEEKELKPRITETNYKSEYIHKVSVDND